MQICPSAVMQQRNRQSQVWGAEILSDTLQQFVPGASVTLLLHVANMLNIYIITSWENKQPDTGWIMHVCLFVKERLTQAHKSLFLWIKSRLPYAALTTYATLPRAHAGKNKQKEKKKHPINSLMLGLNSPQDQLKHQIYLPFDSVGHVQQIVQPEDDKEQHTDVLMWLEESFLWSWWCFWTGWQRWVILLISFTVRWFPRLCPY